MSSSIRGTYGSGRGCVSGVGVFVGVLGMAVAGSGVSGGAVAGEGVLVGSAQLVRTASSRTARVRGSDGGTEQG